MPLAAEEILKKLVETIDEGKSTIRELHEARAAANDVMKKQSKEIHNQINTKVEFEVERVLEDIRQTMINSAKSIIDEIRQDWRTKLGLDN